jgi:hypothetical protein
MAHRAKGPRPAAFAALGGEDPSSLAARLRAAGAVTARHRRLLSAACAGASVVVAVSALTPSAPTPADRSGTSLVLPAGAGAARAAGADRVAMTVRLADPAGLLLLRAGSHAEVLAGPVPDVAGTPSGDQAGEVLAEDAVVLAVPQPPSVGAAGDASGSGVSGMLATTGTGSGGLDGVVVLAVPPADARRIAAVASTRALSVAVAVAVGQEG